MENASHVMHPTTSTTMTHSSVSLDVQFLPQGMKVGGNGAEHHGPNRPLVLFNDLLVLAIILVAFPDEAVHD